MILPDNLKPLPVAPSESEGESSRQADGFVSEAAVRHLLVGPLSLHRERPVFAGRHGFAGRADEAQESPFVSLSADEFYDEAPAKPFQPAGPHPALAAPRRAPAPVPRPGREADFGRSPAAERMWVLAMGVILMALVMGGVLLNLFNRGPSPAVNGDGTFGSPPGGSGMESKASFAATDPEAGMP